jgi:hypothetical protein
MNECFAGSKFPFVNMQGGNSQNNNWPMHMGFQNNSDAFSHQPNNQHKSAGISEITELSHSLFNINFLLSA